MVCMDEYHMELVLSRKVSLIEPGLRLIRRQFAFSTQGRVDLLRFDKSAQFVMVEIKVHADRHAINQLRRYRDLFGLFIDNRLHPRLILCCLSADAEVNTLCELQGISLMVLNESDLIGARVLRYFELPEDLRSTISLLLESEQGVTVSDLTNGFRSISLVEYRLHLVNAYVPLESIRNECGELVYFWPRDFPFTTSPFVKYQPRHISDYLFWDHLNLLDCLKVSREKFGK